MDLVVTDPEDILRVSTAFSSMTRINILKLVAEKPRSITELSNELMMSKGNISSQVAELQNAGLIEISYENGEKGIRKIIRSKYNRIIIVISEPSSGLQESNKQG